MYICHIFFIHPSDGGHIDWALGTLLPGTWWCCYQFYSVCSCLLGIYSREKLLDRIASLILHAVFTVVALTYMPTYSAKVFPFLYTFSSTCHSMQRFFPILTEIRQYIIITSIFISLMGSDAEQFFV